MNVAPTEGLREADVATWTSLLRLLARDRAPLARAAAVSALAGRGAHALLRDCCRDPHPNVRAAAVEALSADVEGNLEIVLRMTSDRDAIVARAAARALGNHVMSARGPGWERIVALLGRSHGSYPTTVGEAAAEAAARVLSRDAGAGLGELWRCAAGPGMGTVLARIARAATSWQIAEAARTLSRVVDPQCEFAEASDDAALAFAAAGEEGIAGLLRWVSARARSAPPHEMGEAGSGEPPPRSQLASLLERAREVIGRAERARGAANREVLAARALAILDAIIDRPPGDLETLCIHRIAHRWRECWAGAMAPALRATLVSRCVLSPGASITVLLENAGERPLTDIELTCSDGDRPVVAPALSPGESGEVEIPCHAPDSGLIEVRGQARYRVAGSPDGDRHGGPPQADPAADGRLCRVEFGGPLRALRPSRLGPVANPYVAGKPLGENSAMFFGRAAEIEFIERAIAAEHGSVVVVVGPRRTGKTSLLQHMAARLSRSCRPAFVDMQGVLASDTDGFLRELALPLLGAPAMAEMLSDGDLGPATSGADMVREAVERSDQRIVLLLDEFDDLERKVRSGRLDRAVLDQLRHLVQHHPNVRLVLSGTPCLEELGGELWSFLLNLAIYRRVGCLNREDAEQVLREPLARLGISCEDAAVARAVRLTGGHPYFLQLLGYRVVERCVASGQGGVWGSSVERAAEEVVEQGDVHLRYLWESAGESGRPIVKLLAEQERSFGADELQERLGVGREPIERAIEHLLGLEIVMRGAGRHRLRVELLGRWLRKVHG